MEDWNYYELRTPAHYPKMILTLDDDPEGDYEGIRRINALDWLMGDGELMYQEISIWFLISFADVWCLRKDENKPIYIIL